MVRRVIQIVYKEIRGLHQAAYVLAVFTFGSQLLALVRDRLLAGTFGAGPELDVYYAAFRLPDLLYVLFASTLSVYVLVPFIASRIETDTAKARHLLSSIFTLFLICYTVLAFVLALCAPYIVPFIFPGFAESTDEIVTLMRILLLQPMLLGVSSLFGVITQLGHRFVLYALSPMLYNVGIIFGILFLYPHYGLTSLVWGVVLGAAAHLVVQLPFILKSPVRPGIVRDIDWPEVRTVLMVSVPRALTLSLHQFVLLGLVAVASVMTVGSVSVFQFAFNLQSVPLAIIGVSYSVAAFPLLAQLYAEGKRSAFSDHLLTALRHIIFWSVPVIALIVVIRAQFVRVVLGAGEFDWDDTRLTAAVLAVFVISLVAQAVQMLLVRALYAVGNTRLPFIVTLCSSIGALISALVMYLWYLNSPALQAGIERALRLEGVIGTEVVVLAIGYTVALLIHTAVLLVLAERELHFGLRNLWMHFYKALFAGLCAGAAAYVTLNILVTGVRTETVIGVFTQGVAAGLMGLLAAIVAYSLVKSEELFEVYRSLQRRVVKTDIVPPQSEDHLGV